MMPRIDADCSKTLLAPRSCFQTFPSSKGGTQPIKKRAKPPQNGVVAYSEHMALQVMVRLPQENPSRFPKCHGPPQTPRSSLEIHKDCQDNLWSLLDPSASTITLAVCFPNPMMLSRCGYSPQESYRLLSHPPSWSIGRGHYSLGGSNIYITFWNKTMQRMMERCCIKC